MNYFKLVFILIAGAFGLYLMLDPMQNGYFHGINLVFHEAGHVVFGIFHWRLLTIAGGTLMQILVPATFTVYFFMRGQRYSASIPGIWLAQSFADCVPYIKDARTMDLILLGGLTGFENGAHDWNNMLYELDILQYDQLIGNIFLGAGVVILAVSVLNGAYYSRKTPGEY